MSTIEVKIDLQMTESYRRPSRGEGTSKINILQSKAPTAMNTGSFASIDKTCRKSPQLRFQNNYWRLQLEGVLQTKTKVHLNAFKITLFFFFFFFKSTSDCKMSKWHQTNSRLSLNMKYVETKLLTPHGGLIISMFRKTTVSAKDSAFIM